MIPGLDLVGLSELKIEQRLAAGARSWVRKVDRPNSKPPKPTMPGTAVAHQAIHQDQLGGR
ncbi:hypothetical protein I6A60_09335 [Frankia sp. AgB1.9]|uniref:hypothetical protein n=1 Tax=unclassified Frankia TaxID=2632575 RepID=UPI001931E839|nr:MULTISPECIES: hypothetical protein [unclassified Frankia]MBL7489475.1 hypothetical protein [Frankia sp. AgW1.1]MBL7548076.1 hypothetical protein [Frankia sp. AgB1.9]MBL7618350.1 hypothetical protein [Frankia sp. AgB1.8]